MSTPSNQPIPYRRLNYGYIPDEAKSFKNGEGVGIVKKQFEICIVRAILS